MPYVGGTYVWGAGNVIDTAISSVVVVDMDARISGVGEFCPCGENYMSAHSQGVQAAACLLALPLIGEGPRQVHHIERIMDKTIGRHGIEEYRAMGYMGHSVKIGADTHSDIKLIEYLEKHRLPDERILYDVNRA